MTGPDLPFSRHGFHDPLAAYEAALTEGVVRRRILAGLVDMVLVGLLLLLAWLVGMAIGLVTLGLGFGLLGLLPVIPVLYNWLFVGMAGATPGQFLLGLAVRRNEDLGPPGGGEALVWALGFAITMGFTLGLLWLCAVLLTVRKRALHDMLPGLVVVRAQALGRPPLTPPGASWNMRSGGYPAA